ncbi:YusW-like protein [Pelagirhabdus alkalitolerans]|uniref:YusW-like protein n=1 Tax=Pelagirhabdus alkalitolerans TaxID=1612202 RepID=A0A1G6JU98_9BACI|nr:YusW family protein [Pelagirhabdus alkalitolerans]SDC22322.1 YusW-like protein [Pelagirhabdus alkalitolerans]
MKYIIWTLFFSVLVGCTSPEEEPIDHTEIETSEETVEEAFSNDEESEEDVEEVTDTEQLNPVGYKLELDLSDEQDWVYEWNGSSYVVEGREVNAEELEEEVMSLLNTLDFSLSMNLNAVNARIFDYLSIDSENVEELELDLTFENGTFISYEYEQPEDEDLQQIFEFELEIEFHNGDEMVYEYDVLENEAEVEQRDGSELDYEASLEAIDVLLYELDVDGSSSINSIKEAVLSTLAIEEDEVETFYFEQVRESDERIQIEHSQR